MSTHTPHPDRTVKVPHLVMAVLFLGVVAAWALAATGALTPGLLPYLAPALLVAAGAAGLAAAALTTRSRRARSATSDPVADPDRDQPWDTMDAPPAPTTRLEEHDSTSTTTDTSDGEPTAPLYRPEDLR